MPITTTPALDRAAASIGNRATVQIGLFAASRGGALDLQAASTLLTAAADIAIGAATTKDGSTAAIGNRTTLHAAGHTADLDVAVRLGVGARVFTVRGV
jgi:hypothetical protein